MLLISGPGGDGRRFRGDHRREQLQVAGIAADVCYRDDVRLASLAGRYRCIVLYRVPWDADVEKLLEDASRRGCAVVCDFDDLVFDPPRADLLRALDELDAEERDAYVEAMAAQRRTLADCGATTVATAPLADAAGVVAPSVEVVHNTVSTEMIRQASFVRRQQSDHAMRIGYLSGTPTHDRDFLEAADAVLALLERDPRARLVVAGFLKLDERFDAHARRVERVPYQPWQRLPALLATLDVNVAPLERDNAFTDCKSCLKYLEAALVCVPTIASARPDFVRVIRDGENGLLADSPDEWREALDRLVEDVGLRRRLGEAASKDVLARHTAQATAEDAAAALERLVPNLR